MLIYKQIPAIIKDIEAVEKSKRPGSQISYAYRSIDEFMNVLNPLLAKHKVTVVPEVLENMRDSYKTSSGATMHSVVMKIKYTFYAEDGSNVCAVMIGESFDSGDKASNKAQSVALKYAIMQVFMVPTEDIEDPDHHDPAKEKPVEKSADKKPVEKKPLVNHAPANPNAVSIDKLKALGALIAKSKLSNEQVAQMIKLRFNKTSKDLTPSEYEEVLATVEASIETEN